ARPIAMCVLPTPGAPKKSVGFFREELATSQVQHAAFIQPRHGREVEVREFLRSRGNQVIVWDVGSKKILATLGSDLNQEQLGFSPDGSQISQGVLLWDIESREQVNKQPVLGILRHGYLANFVLEGSEFVVANAEGSSMYIQFLDARTGERIARHTLAMTAKPQSWSFARDVLASSTRGNAVHLGRISTGEPIANIVYLQRERSVDVLYISPQGHYACDRDVEADLLYVVETEDGRQLTLTPTEFSNRYNWTNDPSQVKLLGD
ncbi:MAG: WD40 repeat domain-containing protein, partial [Planctomycetota bacterium]|nr:WD40 repeat domain-containing protein [Planctomycetota bacterium]